MNITVNGYVYTVRSEADIWQLVAGHLSPNFKVAA